MEYDVEYIRNLSVASNAIALHYKWAVGQYDPGHLFDVKITGVSPSIEGRARFEVEKLVGAGFAGQVYRVKLLELETGDASISGLKIGGIYAGKILVPTSGFSRRFRNLIYKLAYQGPFSAQVLPSAARTGVLWQKLIRRGAKICFGNDQCVVDTYATFFDPGIGSYGEINEWVDGRNWKFEVDDEIFSRRKRFTESGVGSSEYLAKKRFMADLVRLFHDMGAPELARQYEWWSCKSQPNVLKRFDAGDGPDDGLTAIDFRAGLALLFCLPMSPVDIVLVFKGLFRGKLVQFDRGDFDKLQSFIQEHKADFSDLEPALDELKEVDKEYRASLPDITHQGIRLLYDAELRKSVRSGLVQGWLVQKLIDDDHADILNESVIKFMYFQWLGTVPFLGKLRRRLWGNPLFACHLKSLLGSIDYFRKVLRVSQYECLKEWYRDGAVGRKGCEWFLRHSMFFGFIRFTVGLIPMPKLRRFLIDRKYAWVSTKQAFSFPVRFYRDAVFRMEWLRKEVEEGAKQGMLTPAEREHVLTRIEDPFIQKYLKCVAVHFCTLPVTQIVSLAVAVYGYFTFGDTWQESLLWAGGIIVSFQFVPISPGSFVRGMYVAYLIIKERNIKNYWIAMLISFWHYIGYLSFPIQMVGEFPGLARFMAGRWATSIVHIIPVFGEEGALLEHWMFDTFFNRPVSLWKKMKRKG